VSDIKQRSDEFKLKVADIMLRRAIFDQEGFFDEDTGEKIKIYSNGICNEEAQKAIFDLVKNIDGYYMKVVIASLGPAGKNLKTGATQLSTGDGISPVVEIVSSQESASPEDVTLPEISK
jgi:hypothetical protein